MNKLSLERRNTMIRNPFRPTHVSNAVDMRHLIVKAGVRYARLNTTTS